MKVGPMFLVGIGLSLWLAWIAEATFSWLLFAAPAACAIGFLTDAIDARLGWQRWRLW